MWRGWYKLYGGYIRRNRRRFVNMPKIAAVDQGALQKNSVSSGFLLDSRLKLSVSQLYNNLLTIGFIKNIYKL